MGIGFGTLAPALLWPLVADIISSIADLSQEVVCVKAPEEVRSINVKLHSSEFKRARFLHDMDYSVYCDNVYLLGVLSKIL